MFGTFFFKFIYRKSNKSSKTYISIFKYKKELNKDNKSKQDKSHKDDKKEKTTDDDEKSKKGFPFKLISKDNINHLLRFLIKLYRSIRPDIFKLDLLLGLSDPYHKGLISAYYHSLKGSYPKLPVNIEVNWQKEVVEGQGKIAGKIFPIVLISHLIIFIFTPQTIKILWQLYKHKKNK